MMRGRTILGILRRTSCITLPHPERSKRFDGDRHAVRPVVAAAGEHPYLIASHAVTVVLNLVRPLRAARHGSDGRASDIAFEPSVSSPKFISPCLKLLLA